MFVSTLKKTGIFAFTLSILTPVYGENTLDPIKVTASRIESNAELMPVGLISIDEEDIKNSPAKNTAELLNTVGGLNVRSNFGVAGLKADIDLLGIGARGNDNTLLLLNGRKITSFDLGTVNLSTIPINAIKRIEIMPGSGSALYGQGAGGGVINIITKDQYDPSIGLTVTGGDYQTTGTDVWATTQSEHTGFIMQGSALNTDGYRENNVHKLRNAFADIRHNKESTTLYLTTIISDDYYGIPDSRTFSPDGNSDYHNDPSGSAKLNDEASEKRLQIMPGFEYSFTDKVHANIDINYFNKELDSFFEATGEDKRNIETYGVSPRLSGSSNIGIISNLWTIGLDIEQVESEATNAFGTTITEQNNESFYLHNIASVTESTSVTLGARSTNTETDNETQQTDERLEMYQAGIQFKPSQNLAFFANAEKSARLANADEIGFFDGEIKPQTGKLYSAGASWSNGRQQSILTLWHGKFEDEIVYDPTAGFFNAGSNTNLEDKTRRKGATLNSRWRLDDELWLTLNGSIQESTFADGQNRGNDIPLVPRYSSYIQIDWNASEWLNLAITQRHVRERRFDEDVANIADELPNYSWTDLVATFNHDKIWAKVGLYNLTDELATDYGRYAAVNLFNPTESYSANPLPDRHLLATIGITF